MYLHFEGNIKNIMIIQSNTFHFSHFCIICSTTVLSILSTSYNYSPFCVTKAAALVEMTLLMSRATLLTFPVKHELKSSISLVVMRSTPSQFTSSFNIAL